MTVSHDVFISYSHSTDDRLGPALEHGLEKLAKPLLQLRAMDAFIDRTSLTASPGLWPSILDHLAGSKWFLLLASPASAESQWCNKEVLWWLENRSADNLLIILTDGEISWDTFQQDFDWTQTTALSDSLRGCLKYEPLYIDMRWAKNEKLLSLTNLRFRDSVVSIAAPIRGIRKDQLDSADLRQNRRNRLLVRIGVLMIIIAAVLAVWQAIVATKQRHEAELQRDTAQARYLAIQAENAPSKDLGILLAIESLRSRPFIETDMLLRKFVQTAPAILNEHLDVRDYSGNSSAIKILSPKGTYFVAQDKLWHMASKQPLKQSLVSGKKLFSANEKYLAIASGNAVYLITLPEGKRRLVLDKYGTISSLAFSPDSSKIAVGLWTNYDGIGKKRDGHIVIDVSSGQIVGGAVHNGNIQTIAFSPDGRYLTTGGLLWGVEDNFSSMISSYRNAQSTFLPNHDALLVLLESGGRLRVKIDVAGNESLPSWELDSVDQFAITPGGRRLAIARNQFIELYDDKGKPIREMPLQYDNVDEIKFIDNTHLVVRWDKRMALLDVSRALQLVMLDQQFFPWDLDNATIVTYENNSRKGLFKLWRIGGGNPIARMWHEDKVCNINFNRQGTRLITASEDGTARVWNVPDGEELVLVKHNQPVTSVWFSPDGQTAVSAGSGHAMWWETETGKVLKRIRYRPEHKPYFVMQGECKKDHHKLAVSFAGSAPLLAVATEDEEIDVHRFTNDNPPVTIKHEMDEDSLSHRGDNLRVAFENDGQRLITSNSNAERPIRSWDVSTGQLVDTGSYGEGFIQYMQDVRFWPKRIDQNGHYIANRVDKHLIVTTSDNGSELVRLLDENGASSIAISPDEKYIATAGTDGAVNLFFLKTEDLISDACKRVTRNLSKEEWKKYVGTEEYRKTCPSLPE